MQPSSRLRSSQTRFLLLSQNNGKFYFAFSKGDGTYESPTPVTRPNGWDYTRVFVGDFNGDGIFDLVSENNGNFYFVYSKGDGTYQSPAPVSSPNGWDPSVSHVQVADFSGDGIADLVSHNNGNFIWALRTSAFPDLLTNVTNSLGGQSTVTYKPLTDGSVHVKETTAAYPTVDVQYPLYVVSNITVNPGVGASYEYDYTYVGAKADSWGRGSLGFHQTMVTDPSADSKTTTTNNQIFPKIGLPSAVEVDRLSDGPPFRDTNYEYQTDNAYSSAPTVSFVKPRIIDTVEWEGGQTSRTIRREMQYDSTTTGNLAQVHHHGDINDPNDDRYEITEWIPVDPAKWLHRPKRQALLDKTGSVVLREKWLYYDGSDYGQIGDFGLLTKEELNGGGAQGSGNNNPVSGVNPVTTYVNEPVFGIPTTITDPRGCPTTIEYESTKTFPNKITNCLSQYVTYEWDLGLGVKKNETDVNRVPTAYTHDDFGRLTAVIEPLDSEGAPTIIFDYPDWGDPQNQQVATFRRAEHGGDVLRSSDFFDGLGRVYQMTQEGPNQTVRQSEANFDSRGLALSAIAPHFSTENPPPPPSFTYDPVGRLTQITYPDRPPVTIDYFVPGRVDVTDENGHLKRKWFDAYQRLIRVDEFNNGGTETYTTSYEYDPAGSLRTVTNSQGHMTRMVYDKLGRKTIMCDPNMGTATNVTQGECEAGIAGAWRYTYNPAGDLLTQQDAITTKGVRDQTLTFTYDLLGRPTSKSQGSTALVQWTYDSHSIAPPPPDTDYPVGRLTQINQPATATTTEKITQFAYDKVGHPLQTKRKLLGSWYILSQSYDALDRITSQTLENPTGDGERVTYDYNGEWVQSITSPNSNYVNGIQYNARGQMAEQNGVPALTYGNNLVSQFSYNPNNFRTTARTTSSNQQNTSYLYDHVGNVTSITDNLFTATRSFSYDDLNRAVTGSGTFGANPPQSSQDCTYEYDSIGNMTKKCGADLQYDDPKHPSAVTRNVATGKIYEYDDNGNMTRRGTQTLTWDVDNRLVKIEGGGTTVIEYDSVGQRLIKNGPTGITLFPFDGIEIAGEVITKYIKIGGEIFAAKTATNQRFYHNDHLGGVNAITDTDLNNLRCQLDEYEPWGSVSREEGNCDPTHRFTGKELDPETEIYYYGGRHYDQDIGRFISPDPFVPSPDDPQNLNRYSYALNNPQRYTDPTGYVGEDVSSAIGVIGWAALAARVIKWFVDLSSSPDKPNIVRLPKTADNNKRQSDIRNEGRETLKNVSVYGDDSTGPDPIMIALATETGRCLSNVRTFVDKYLADAQALATQLPKGATAQEVLATAGNETLYGSMDPKDRTLAPYGNFFGLHGTGCAGQIGTYTTQPPRGTGVVTPVFPLSSGFRLSGQVFVKTVAPHLANVNAADPRTFFETIHAHGYGTGTPNYVNYMMRNLPGNRGPYFLVGACLAR